MQGGTLRTGQNQNPVSVECGRCLVKTQVREDRSTPHVLLVLRGKSRLSYLPVQQGHWDTVSEYKDIFLKAFQFCALKPFCKDDF